MVNGLPEIVATVGGKPVTRDELMEFAAAEIIAAEAAAAQARSGALENFVVTKLMEAEAEDTTTEVTPLGWPVVG